VIISSAPTVLLTASSSNCREALSILNPIHRLNQARARCNRQSSSGHKVFLAESAHAWITAVP